MSKMFPYLAFLSYSHRDTDFAEWLQERLESYKVPHLAKDKLARRQLSPIFRDRLDFSAGHSLNSQTLNALTNSQFLIVVCSRSSASSLFVNAEAKAFLSSRPDGLIIPVIAPGAGEIQAADLFPPVLRQQALSGALVAADARPDKDGRDIAFLKVVSGLLGLPLDFVRQREALDYRKALHKKTAVIAIISSLSLFGGYLGYRNQSDERARSQQLAEMPKLLNLIVNEALAAGAGVGGITGEKALIGALGECSRRDSDPRACTALELLKDGKREDAEQLYRAVAQDKIRARSALAKDAAAAFRNYATIAALSNPKSAQEAYTKALDLDPSDRTSLYGLSSILVQAGDFQQAEALLRSLHQLARSASDELSEFGSYMLQSAIQSQSGSLEKALKLLEQAGDVAARRKVGDDDEAWRRATLAVVEREGDYLVLQGDVPGAVDRYLKAAKLAENELGTERKSEAAQRDLTVSLHKLGDVYTRVGRFNDARSAYDRAALITEASATGGRNGWQRVFSISLERLGDLSTEQKYFADAARYFERAYDLRKALVASDRQNLLFQREYTVILERMGDLKLEAGDLERASSFYKEVLAIRSKLSLGYPENLTWQDDLSVALERMGNWYGEKGDYTAAERSFREASAINSRLTELDPLRRDWRYRLAVSKYKVGLAVSKAGNAVAARAELSAALAIIEGLLVLATDRNWVDAKAAISDELARTK